MHVEDRPDGPAALLADDAGIVLHRGVVPEPSELLPAGVDPALVQGALALDVSLLLELEHLGILAAPPDDGVPALDDLRAPGHAGLVVINGNGHYDSFLSSA